MKADILINFCEGIANKMKFHLIVLHPKVYQYTFQLYYQNNCDKVGS